MDEPLSKFSINTVRELFLVGEGPHTGLLTKLVKSFYFLAAKPGKDLTPGREETHFVVACIDFEAPLQVQAYVRLFTELTSPLTHKLAFILSPETCSGDQLLLLQEIGVRYVAMGIRRNDDFKDYLKRICLELHQVGSLEPFAAELELTRRSGDLAGTRQLIDKLRDLPVQSEAVLRLLACASIQANDFRRSEVYLRKLLTLNPQHLWAANTLGRFYMKSGRVAAGVEILERLSTFHELNGERLLELGNAYVKAGMPRQAEAKFVKGDGLAEGKDPRFKDGLAKVKLSEKDFMGAMALAQGRQLTPDVISFLNMRAILLIRADRFDEGMEYYRFAFDGAGDDKAVQAKLKFNMGIAYVRTQDLERAEACFTESAQLGGRSFARGQVVLRQVRTQIKLRAKQRENAANGIAPTEKDAAREPGAIADNDWETLY